MKPRSHDSARAHEMPTRAYGESDAPAPLGAVIPPPPMLARGQGSVVLEERDGQMHPSNGARMISYSPNAGMPTSQIALDEGTMTTLRGLTDVRETPMESGDVRVRESDDDHADENEEEDEGATA